MRFETRLKRLEALVPQDTRPWHERALDTGRQEGIPRLDRILMAIRRHDAVRRDRRADAGVQKMCSDEIKRLIPALEYEATRAVRGGKPAPDLSDLIAKGLIRRDWTPG